MTSKFVRHKNSLQLYFNRHFIEYILHVVVVVVVRLPATGGKALQCTLGYSVARVRLQSAVALSTLSISLSHSLCLFSCILLGFNFETDVKTISTNNCTIAVITCRIFTITYTAIILWIILIELNSSGRLVSLFLLINC